MKHKTEITLNIVAVATGLIGLILSAMVLLGSVGLAGPNCPGKDPEWLGWCEEAPVLQ